MATRYIVDFMPCDDDDNARPRKLADAAIVIKREGEPSTIVNGFALWANVGLRVTGPNFSLAPTTPEYYAMIEAAWLYFQAGGPCDGIEVSEAR